MDESATHAPASPAGPQALSLLLAESSPAASALRGKHTTADCASARRSIVHDPLCAAARQPGSGFAARAWLRRFVAVVVLGLFACAGAAAESANDDYAEARRSLVAEVAALAQSLRGETGMAGVDPRVLEAMARVPRHRFVPAAEAHAAYRNRPLPIGHGQTISQPYIVAVMTDLMRLRPSDRVLEIGTGSGYQAAILAELADGVYSIEIIEPLAAEARARLDALGYAKVRSKVGDGYYGWEEHGPYDSIIVTAAVSHVPPPLVRQLKPGGRMVMPLGAPFLPQQLMLVEKQPDGSIVSRQVLPVRFVPLTGGH